jgi:hypothetical protein
MYSDIIASAAAFPSGILENGPPLFVTAALIFDHLTKKCRYFRHTGKGSVFTLEMEQLAIKRI